MPQHKSPLYDYGYFIKNVSTTVVNNESVTITTVKCNIDSCTHLWTKTSPDTVSVTVCKAHMKHQHVEKFKQFEAWTRSGSTLPPQSFIVPSSSSSSSVTSSNTVNVHSPHRSRVNDMTDISDCMVASDSQLESAVLKSVTAFMAMCNIPIHLVTNDAFRISSIEDSHCIYGYVQYSHSSSH
jgi:hypothetical protein